MKKTPTLFMLSVPAALAVACVFALPSVSPADTPDAYLDYVESSGTQYIDTGVVGKSGTRMAAEMEWVAKPSVQSTFCGASNDGKYVTPYTSAGTHQVGYASLSQYQILGGGNAANANTRFLVTTTLEAGSQSIGVRSVNGSGYNGSRTYTDSASVDLGCTLYVFARNDSGMATQFASARLYSLKFWQKDGNGDWQLVGHFLPCSKDGTAALYDKENGIIHYPQGGALRAGSVLPRPAEFVEWVQADGADGSRGLFIDTGVPGWTPIGMTADMEWTATPAGYGTNSVFCGAADSSGNHIWLYDAVADAGNAAATHRFGYYTWKLQLQSNSVVRAGTRYHVEAHQTHGDQHLSVFDSAGVGAERSNGERSWSARGTDRTLYLFANNNDGTAEPISASARLYSLVLTNEIGVVRDFVPCVADNGKAGLYDTVSERVFFPQAAVEGATAEFDLATEVGGVTNAPATTKWPLFRPEWIEANGTNDYVNLGVVARDGTRMLAEVEWNAIPAAATFCGAATNSTHGLFSTYRVTSDFHRMGYYNGSSTLGGANCAPVAGVRYRVETSLASGEQIITVSKQENGAWVAVGAGTRTANLSFPAGYGNLGLPLYLFARNFNGVPDEFAHARLYSFKLWQGGTLVRDLAPAFDPADDAPALFDKVSERYFRNNGGYRLTAGGGISAFPGEAMVWILK